MVDNSIPWPRKGDKLFKSERKDWWHNACLNFASNQWDLYAEGYKRAGNILVEYIEDTGSHQDVLVYPVVFLYRQYIELRLKELIQNGNRLLGNTETVSYGHEINKLWTQCRKILETVWPNDSTLDLDAMEEYIQQFSEKDPLSQAFRYPAYKNGKPSLPDLEHINLRNLSEVMERISSLLDGVSMGISAYLMNQCEMEM